MRTKHIKIQWLQRDPQPSLVANPSPDECLWLAARAEELDHKEWAQYWLDQALIEEAQVARRLEVRA